MASAPLKAFTPQVRDWFTRAFAEPTAAQAQAWPAIATGDHVLISAPTGSGKTLAAFLWSLDRLASTPPPEEAVHRCDVGAGGDLVHAPAPVPGVPPGAESARRGAHTDR